MSAVNQNVAMAVFAKGCTPTQKHVLLMLAIMAKSNGFAEASVSDICRWTGLSDRAVSAALAELEKARHLTRYRAAGQVAQTQLHPRG